MLCYVLHPNAGAASAATTAAGASKTIVKAQVGAQAAEAPATASNGEIANK